MAKAKRKKQVVHMVLSLPPVKAVCGVKWTPITKSLFTMYRIGALKVTCKNCLRDFS